MNGTRSDVGFLGCLDFSEFLPGGHHMLVLNSHDTTSPCSSELIVLVEVLHEAILEVIEVGKIFLSDVSQSNAGSGLGVAELSKSCFSLDEAEWNSLLSAKSWQENHDFEWVDIMSNHDELGLTFFDKGSDMVETKFKMHWLWGCWLLVTFVLGLSFSNESVLLLLFGFWRVLVEELKELGCLVLFNGL